MKRFCSSALILFCTIFSFLGTNALANDKFHILALGDSLTAGYGLSKEQGFVPQLESRLHEAGYDHVRITNAGISGDTTRGGAERIGWLLKQQDYDMVMIALGANDALRALDPQSLRDNLSTIIETIQAKDIENLLLIGMYSPPNYGPIYADDFNKSYPELAKKYDIPLMPFFLEGVAGNPDLNQADGIHPNQKGVEIMIKNTLPYLQTLIRK